MSRAPIARISGAVIGSMIIGSSLAAPALAVPHPAPAAPAVSAPAAPAVARPAAETDILARLKAIPGLTVEEKAAPAGYRFFTMTFTQQADHRDPSRGTFQQRLTLLHKDVSRPMVMYTSGYYVSQRPNRSEPTQIVDGNQLSMEYRFFDPSRPANPDWSPELTIWQAATDQHEIIQAFKSIYDKNWLTTGGSKGGMTAVYHRRFYPGDVSGTIPYVAPNDVRDHTDVYNKFLSQVGTASCRDAITALQRKALGSDRAWFFTKAAKESAAANLTYDIVGNQEKAVESAIVDAFFAFWQYSPEAECANIPAVTADNEKIYAWFEQVSSLTTYSDQSVGYFTPYYFQAAYQLGSPEPYEDRLRDLLHFPGADVALTFVPKEIRPNKFDRRAMPDIDGWVRHRSRNMLFIYGENDPWSAEPFRCGTHGDRRACYRFYVPGGTHGSRIAALPEPQRTFATNLVLSWAGLAPTDSASLRIRAFGAPANKGSLDRVLRVRGGM